MKKVAVLCGGGSSSERVIGLRSGRAVFEALKSKVEVQCFELSLDALPPELDPEHWIVLPMIHGEFGEDGQLQALLEAKKFSYCGSDAAASALCMDKTRTKAAVQSHGILTARSLRYAGQNFRELWEYMGGPLVIKPNNRGSSIGISRIGEREDFNARLKDLQEGSWLVESWIKGREITVGILENKALPVIEIRVKEGFYDYQHKYTSGMTEYEVPAPIGAKKTQYIQHIAEEIFSYCGCRDFARLDFILTERGEFYFLEVNTIPGMTATSLVPKAAAAAGISFTDLCLKMLAAAIERDRSSQP
ncbi:MAG: D-alanine--D-alanine ligase [Puniceicoccales bacterium]|jgi:D-alanine-D-alanine ligase|nr:D-alanine--D-alanine ligase [Puniceicoccales bacterium]